MRQQRRNNARGNVPFRQNATVPNLIAAISNVLGTDLQLTFGSIQPNVTLNGIPQVIRQADSSTPISASWGAELLTLQYGTNIEPAEDFTLAAHDAAFRGSTGEYIAAFTLQTTPAPPAPQGVTVDSGATAIIGKVNVPNTDNATLTTPTGTIVGQTFAVSVPSSFISGCALTSSTSGSPIAAGATTVFTYDGTNWSG